MRRTYKFLLAVSGAAVMFSAQPASAGDIAFCMQTKKHTTSTGRVYNDFVLYGYYTFKSAISSDLARKDALDQFRTASAYRDYYRTICLPAPDSLSDGGYYHFIETYAQVRGSSAQLRFAAAGYGSTARAAKNNAFAHLRRSGTMPNFDPEYDEWFTISSGRF